MKKEIWQNIIILLVSVFLLFCILEISLRLYRCLTYNEKLFARLGYQSQDQLLGWQGTKIFGDKATKKIKIFFVGDSFTALEGNLKEDQMYYSIVKNNLNIEMFVYGGGGYGTTQEYLVIDKYIDLIQPDLVVLQVSSNDFINNSWKLEKASYIHNNYMIRPYYENGRIVYRFPRGPYFVRKYILPYSYFIYYVLSRIDKTMSLLASRGLIKTIESQIETKGICLSDFRESVNITSELVVKIKKRCRQVPIVVDNEPYFTQFKAIFKKNTIDFVDEIPALAWRAELQAHPRMLKDNDHWSDIGQRACGEYLSKFLRDKIKKSVYAEN